MGGGEEQQKDKVNGEMWIRIGEGGREKYHKVNTASSQYDPAVIVCYHSWVVL